MSSDEEQQKPKIKLMLQDSAKGASGLVLDCGTSYPIGKEDLDKLDPIGYWTKDGDGTSLITLTTTIEARQDTLINLLKKVRESRIAEFGSPYILAKYPNPASYDGTVGASSTKRVRNPRTQVNEPDEPLLSSSIGSLRDRLKRGSTSL